MYSLSNKILSLVVVGIITSGCAANKDQEMAEKAWIEQHSLYDGDDSALFVNSEFKSKDKKDAEPPTKEAYIARGDQAWRSGDTELALFEYLRALKLDEQDKIIYLKIGLVHEGRSNDRLSEAAYKEALIIDPDYIPVIERLGKIILKKRNYIEAKIAFDNAVRLDRERLLRLSIEQVAAVEDDNKETDDEDSAQTGEEEVVSDVPVEAPLFDRQSPFYAYNGLGVIYDLEGEHEQAMENYEIARQILPRSAMIYNNIGYSYYLVDNLEVAENFFSQAVALNSDYAEAWRNLALLYVRQGRYEKAVHVLVSKFDDMPSAYNTVGYLCMLDKKFDSADEYFQLAINTSPVYYKVANENMATNRKLYSQSVYEELTHN